MIVDRVRLPKYNTKFCISIFFQTLSLCLHVLYNIQIKRIERCIAKKKSENMLSSLLSFIQILAYYSYKSSRWYQKRVIWPAKEPGRVPNRLTRNCILSCTNTLLQCIPVSSQKSKFDIRFLLHTFLLYTPSQPVFSWQVSNKCELTPPLSHRWNQLVDTELVLWQFFRYYKAGKASCNPLTWCAHHFHVPNNTQPLRGLNYTQNTL